MKKKLKFMMVMVLSIAMVISGSVFAFAENDSNQFDPSKYEYNVMVDGDYVSFTDAEPVNVNGRIMVPFRVILETLGAEVSWDGTTKTVNAKLGNTNISFVVGQPNINIVSGDQKSVKTMDVVPYIDSKTDRTYVSTRFVAESLGYDVGWDSEEKTAVLIDYDKIFANSDKAFSVLDKYLADSNADPSATYESVMNVALKANLSKDFLNLFMGNEVFTKDADLSIVLDGTALSKELEASMDMSLKMNLADLFKLLPSGTVSAQDLVDLAKLSDLKFKAYIDMESGDLYFTTSANSVFDETYTDKTWFKLNIYDIYGGLGVDVKDILDVYEDGDADNMSGILSTVVETSSADMTISTYDETVQMYNILEMAFGDSSLKETKSGATTTYTADLSSLSKIEGLEGCSGKLVLTENSGKFGCEFELSINIEGMGSLTFSLDSTSAKTTKSIEKVPSDAVIESIE